MIDNFFQKNNKKKNNKDNNLLVCCVIFIILVIALLCINKAELQSFKRNNLLDVNINEGFQGLEPDKYNKPRNFELYKIDNLNNKIHFIFNPPKPNIISNQVISYILIIIAYKKEADNKFKILEKQLVYKTTEELQSGDSELVNRGLLKFTINMPQKSLKLKSDNKDDVSKLVIDEDIYYKFGLIANYKNVFSEPVTAMNISTKFSLNSGFDYIERQQLFELGRDFRDRLKKKELDEEIINNKSVDVDYKFKQISDSLGDYPLNLFIENDNFKKEVRQNLADGVFNFKVN